MSLCDDKQKQSLINEAESALSELELIIPPIQDF